MGLELNVSSSYADVGDIRAVWVAQVEVWWLGGTKLSRKKVDVKANAPP